MTAPQQEPMPGPSRAPAPGTADVQGPLNLGKGLPEDAYVTQLRVEDSFYRDIERVMKVNSVDKALSSGIESGLKARLTDDRAKYFIGRGKRPIEVEHRTGAKGGWDSCLLRLYSSLPDDYRQRKWANPVGEVFETELKGSIKTSRSTSDVRGGGLTSAVGWLSGVVPGVAWSREFKNELAAEKTEGVKFPLKGTLKSSRVEFQGLLMLRNSTTGAAVDIPLELNQGPALVKYVTSEDRERHLIPDPVDNGAFAGSVHAFHLVGWEGEPRPMDRGATVPIDAEVWRFDMSPDIPRSVTRRVNEIVGGAAPIPGDWSGAKAVNEFRFGEKLTAPWLRGQVPFYFGRNKGPIVIKAAKRDAGDVLKECVLYVYGEVLSKYRSLDKALGKRIVGAKYSMGISRGAKMGAYTKSPFTVNRDLQGKDSFEYGDEVEIPATGGLYKAKVLLSGVLQFRYAVPGHRQKELVIDDEPIYLEYSSDEEEDIKEERIKENKQQAAERKEEEAENRALSEVLPAYPKSPKPRTRAQADAQAGR